MELHVVSDGELYTRSLEEATWEILQGADVKKEWRQLQEKHCFFQDVVADADRQARSLASLLAAMEFFLQRLMWCCECGTAPSCFDVNVVKRWRASLSLFLSLYELSPVPTRARWAEAAQKRGEKNALDFADGKDEGDNEDEDDGSFVETRLKELVMECISPGRVWYRQLSAEENSVIAEKVGRVVSIMESFVVPRTLEW